jgi:Ca2+-binding RTX toxin-like protein
MAIIEGNSRTNRLRGTSDADIVIGLGGADTLYGGAADDILYGDDGELSATFGFGNDRLFGGDGRDLLIGGAGADVLNGGAGDDILIGGLARAAAAGSGLPFLHAATIDGGNDIYDGGGGIDLAVLVYDRVTGVTLSIADPRATAAILAGASQIGSIRGVEQLRFHGGDGNDQVIGGALSDVLAGGAGADHLQGGDGGDRILGGRGDDLLDGGAGFDVVSYEDAAAGVTIDLRLAGVAQDTRGAGRDTLIGFEQLDGSAFADHLTGSDGADFLSGGSGGNDRMEGGLGSDSFYQYRAAGEVETASVMFGGAGDDVATLVAGAGARDRFTFNGGAGGDTVHISGDGRYQIDLGNGDDTAGISLARSVIALELGAGVDTIVLEAAGALPRRWVAPIVRDFLAGDNGDRIDLRGFLDAHAEDYVANSDPFAGFARLIARDGETLVQIDRDAGGTAFAFETVLRLGDAALADFTAFNFGGFDPVVVEAGWA